MNSVVPQYVVKPVPLIRSSEKEFLETSVYLHKNIIGKTLFWHLSESTDKLPANSPQWSRNTLEWIKDKAIQVFFKNVQPACFKMVFVKELAAFMEETGRAISVHTSKLSDALLLHRSGFISEKEDVVRQLDEIETYPSPQEDQDMELIFTAKKGVDILPVNCKMATFVEADGLMTSIPAQKSPEVIF